MFSYQLTVLRQYCNSATKLLSSDLGDYILFLDKVSTQVSILWRHKSFLFLLTVVRQNFKILALKILSGQIICYSYANKIFSTRIGQPEYIQIRWGDSATQEYVRWVASDSRLFANDVWKHGITVQQRLPQRFTYLDFLSSDEPENRTFPILFSRPQKRQNSWTNFLKANQSSSNWNIDPLRWTVHVARI